mmetsp:Transcript_24947/g.59998  ORF Transcript_24947/g.59998 Transcript_24947/m.59998 type:complete len:88 (+) Transcript_24947:2494-2757(+)
MGRGEGGGGGRPGEAAGVGGRPSSFCRLRLRRTPVPKSGHVPPCFLGPNVVHKETLLREDRPVELRAAPRDNNPTPPQLLSSAERER